MKSTYINNKLHLWYIIIMTELAIPAGKLENAIVAYRHGADAVYFGLKDFSARKGAGNFSEEDLSKIARLASELGRKYYITINTLIDDSKLPELYDALKTAAKYRPDGIIVQDLGIASIIKSDFPELPLHGSTQLAVHTANGVRELKRLGFERAVLSRELNLDEIKRIRETCPDIELKVFIHGALCYGFSGLCMASHIITGRSANEGECAQICRTYFKDKATGRNIYPFSLCDMEAGKLVRELRNIGIDSLKVEGRLKGNEYVAAVTDYYRAILDGKDYSNLEHPLAISFRRKPSDGYLSYNGPGHKRLTTGSYTGHLGELIGTVLKADKLSIEIGTDYALNDRDGLMILLSDGAYKFPSKIVKRTHNGYIVKNIGNKSIPMESEVYRISDSTLNLRCPSTDIPLKKKDVEITITVEKDRLCIMSKLSEKEYEIKAEEARRGNSEDAIMKIFSQSGDSEFQPTVKAITNRSGFSEPYINTGLLKKIRRDYLSGIKATDDNRSYVPSADRNLSQLLPERSLLCDGPYPWNMKGVEIGGYTYFSFPPVTFSEEALFQEMKKQIRGRNKVRIGLNNISQLAFARENKEAEYFADIYLYLSNREAATLLKNNIENLIGGYLWLERSDYIKPWPFSPSIVKDYTPPLFISRACYRHDGIGLDCKNCSRNSSFSLTQNGIDYAAYVKDCITVLLKG